MNNGNTKYEDIISLPHHISKKHKQMSMQERAAQFAPFSALTGLENAVKETARFTEKKKEIDEELKVILDNKLKIIQKQILNRPQITFTYYIPDNKKEGGKYVEVTGNVYKIDIYNEEVLLENGIIIPINEIIDIRQL